MKQLQDQLVELGDIANQLGLDCNEKLSLLVVSVRECQIELPMKNECQEECMELKNIFVNVTNSYASMEGKNMVSELILKRIR